MDIKMIGEFLIRKEKELEELRKEIKQLKEKLKLFEQGEK
tara:strand:- start:1248 stop:1367 length:120 start_codon:yes stop_codon:yes gene_type:complete